MLFLKLQAGILVSVVVSLLLSACMKHGEVRPEESAIHQGLIHFAPNSIDNGQSVAINQNRENAITTVVQDVRETVVYVKVKPDSQQFRIQEDVDDSGHVERSGFIVSEEGHIVTNFNFSPDKMSDIMITDINGTTYTAKLVGMDTYSGISLLQIDSVEEFPFVIFGDSDALMVGEWSIAMGVTGSMSRYDTEPAVSAGVISSKDNFVNFPADHGETVYPDLIRTDAMITPLLSGGPMLNANGHVVGLNIHLPVSDHANEELGYYGYAIPGNKVTKMINYLANDTKKTLSYSMGLEMVPVSGQLARQYRLPVEYGLFVLGVNRDGPAFQGGVMPGDIIIRIGNEMITGDTHAWSVLSEFKTGDQMPMTLLRSGMEMHINLMLRKRQKEE